MSAHSGSVVEPPVLTSRDIVAGLGAAPRDLLAAGLGLFEDSTLLRRLATLIDKLTSDKSSRDDDTVANEAAAQAIQSRIAHWHASPLPDDALRVLLWIYLREAFALPALTFASRRSASTAADDLVAVALHSLRPGKLEGIFEKFGWRDVAIRPQTLDSLARQTLDELMTAVMDADDAQSAAARERILLETRDHLLDLDADDRARLLEVVGADELNDAALRKILLTGGGLTAFGTGVSLAGFSAYILAAQISAFIPLVSGPALVSMVAVLANPITIIVATAGMGWWATRSASERVRAGIAVRVSSLLALTGMTAGDTGQRTMCHAFRQLDDMRDGGDAGSKVLGRYRDNWRAIAAARRNIADIDPVVLSLMEHPVDSKAHSRRSEHSRGFFSELEETRNTAALAALTLGDVAYQAFAIDPTVMQAADFARAADLQDPAAFALFAHRIEGMNPAAQLGAISDVKGYVAERVVAAQLSAQGHVVEFPATSNQLGWDISVDGTKFQIKDLQDLSGIEHHFSRYDYPVIANGELAHKLADHATDQMPSWAHHVHFVEGYDNEVVEQVTRHSLDAGDHVLHPHVPLFTMALSAVRNVGRMNRGEVTGTQAFQEVLLDGGTRAGLAVVGNYAGVAIGLLVFGPAGALVLGSVVPILSQRQSHRLKAQLDTLVKDGTYLAWAAEARRGVAALITKAETCLLEKAELLKNRRPVEPTDVATSYVQWRLDEEVCFLREAWCRLRRISDDSYATVEATSANLMTWLSTSTLHPVNYQAELSDLSEAFMHRPSTADRIANVAQTSAERVRVWFGRVTDTVMEAMNNDDKRQR
jgi:hypothetical protein